MYASALFRLELLALAGSNVKLAFDAALAGYYSACMSLERHMLETWRRVAYVRLHPEDVWRWIPQSASPKGIIAASDDVPVEKGGMPTSIPKADRIGNVILARGDDDDRDILDLVRSGFDALSVHTHPSFAGAAQTRSFENILRRTFGPTYDENQAIDCIEWGLIAGAMLLTEVGKLAGSWPEWEAQLNALKIEIGLWRKATRWSGARSIETHPGTQQETECPARGQMSPIGVVLVQLD